MEGSLTREGAAAHTIQVFKGGMPILTITKDGKVEPGPGLLMDEVAKAFLQELSVAYRDKERKLEDAESKLRLATDYLYAIASHNTYQGSVARDTLVSMGLPETR